MEHLFDYETLDDYMNRDRNPVERGSSMSSIRTEVDDKTQEKEVENKSFVMPYPYTEVKRMYTAFHASGMIHDDAHCRNIMIHPETHDIKLIDFQRTVACHRPRIKPARANGGTKSDESDDSDERGDEEGIFDWHLIRNARRFYRNRAKTNVSVPAHVS